MARMLAKLAWRGPDAEGQHADGPVRLGRRRLAIIDLSPSSKQRMLDASSGTALVFNGTLYNYPGLRAELIGRGHASHSDGGAEVILRAYVECRAPARHVRVRYLEPRDAVSGTRPPRHQALTTLKLRLLPHCFDPASAAGWGWIGTGSALTVNAHYEHQTPGS